MLLPGASVPPVLTVTAPMVPFPPRVPVLLTVCNALAEVPLTSNVPAFTAVLPVYVLLSFRTSVPVPVALMSPPVPLIWPFQFAVTPLATLLLMVPRVTAVLPRTIGLLIVEFWSGLRDAVNPPVASFDRDSAGRERPGIVSYRAVVTAFHHDRCCADRGAGKRGLRGKALFADAEATGVTVTAAQSRCVRC